MRVLDLGCGVAASSIFLRREFGVQVWATDLWFHASDNVPRIRTPRSMMASSRSMPTPDPCRSLRISRRHREHRRVHLLRDGRPVPDLPGSVREAGWRVGGRPERTGARSTASPRTLSERGRAPAWGAFTRPRGGVGTGGGPASCTSTWPIRCPTVGSCGATGKAMVALDNTVEIRSGADHGSYPATSASSAADGRTYAWTNRSCLSRACTPGALLRGSE